MIDGSLVGVGEIGCCVRGIGKMIVRDTLGVVWGGMIVHGT